MRKFRVVLAVLVVMLLSVGVMACGGSKVTGIELNSTAETILVGDTFQLTATISPEKAKDETVTWASSNEAVATVSGGLVTGVAEGQAVITATAGEKSASATITVEEEVIPPVDPRGISTPEDLQKIRDNLSGSFFLTNDIDFGGAEIDPIGDQELWNHATQSSANGDAERDVPNGFRGTLDGRGYALKNFKIKAGPPNAENSCYNNALFPGLYGGTIKNLALIGVSQTLGDADDLSRPSLLVNSLYTGTIENVYIEGTITAPARADNWRRGGTIFGGTGDDSNPVGEKYVTIRNVVTNVTIAGAANQNMIYPVSGRIEGPSTNGNTTITNVFIVNDGLDQAALAGSNPTRVTASSVFALSAVASQNFSALPTEYWDGTQANGLPKLKQLAAPSMIPVTGITLNKTETTINAPAPEKLVATLQTAGGDPSYPFVEWTIEKLTGNGEVARVEQDGTVWAVSAGTARVTATALDEYAGNFSASCLVTVTADEVKMSAITLNITGKQTLYATGGGVNGFNSLAISVTGTAPAYPTNSAVAWSMVDKAENGAAISYSPVIELAGDSALTRTVHVKSAGTAFVKVASVDGAVSQVIEIEAKAYNPEIGIAVGTVAEFEKITNSRSLSFYLTADIDFGGKSYNTAIIGTGNSDAQAFTGVLDGRGYALKNFKLTHTGSGSTGVIARLGVNEGTTVAQAEAGKNGVVRNIAATGVTITSNGWQAGVLVGANYGLIQNVYTEADFANTATDGRPGGLIAGANESGKGLIRTSISNGTKSSAYTATQGLGGMTGWNAQLYDNFFVTSAGITGAIGNNNTANAGATAVAPNAIATTDFSVLPAMVWDLTGEGLPVLKKLGVPQAANITVVGADLAGAGFTLNTESVVARYSSYAFSLTIADGYRVETEGENKFAVKVSINGGADQWMEYTSKSGSEYTFSLGTITEESGIVIKAVRGVIQYFNRSLSYEQGINFKGAATIDAGNDYTFSFTIRNGFVFDGACTKSHSHITTADLCAKNCTIPEHNHVCITEDDVCPAGCAETHTHILGSDVCPEDCDILTPHITEADLCTTEATAQAFRIGYKVGNRSVFWLYQGGNNNAAELFCTDHHHYTADEACAGCTEAHDHITACDVTVCPATCKTQHAHESYCVLEANVCAEGCETQHAHILESNVCDEDCTKVHTHITEADVCADDCEDKHHVTEADVCTNLHHDVTQCDIMHGDIDPTRHKVTNNRKTGDCALLNGLYEFTIPAVDIDGDFEIVVEGIILDGSRYEVDLSTDAADYPFVDRIEGSVVDPDATGDAASSATFPMMDYEIKLWLKDGYVVDGGKVSLTLGMDQGKDAPILFKIEGQKMITIDDGEYWYFLIDVDENMENNISGITVIDAGDVNGDGKKDAADITAFLAAGFTAITGDLYIPAYIAEVEAVEGVGAEGDPDYVEEVEAVEEFSAFSSNIKKLHTVTGLGDGADFTVEADEDIVIDGKNYYFTVTVDEAGKIPTVTYTVGGGATSEKAEFVSSSEDGTVFEFCVSKVKGDLALTVALADQTGFTAVEGGEDAGWFNTQRNVVFTVLADDVATVGVGVTGSVTYAGELLSGNANTLVGVTDGVAISGSGVIEFRFWFIVDGVRMFYVDVTIEALNLPGVTAEWTPISTPEEFNAMRYNENGNYYLTNDIVFTGTEAERTILSLFPSSPDSNTASIGFKGTFDGRGYAIKNVRLRQSAALSDHNVGLFGQIASTGVVKNVSVVGFDIDTWRRGGSIATYIYGTVENIYLEGKFTSRYNNANTIGNNNWDRSSTIAAGVRAGGVLKNVVAKVDTKASPNPSGVFAVTNVQKPQSAPNSTVAGSIANVFVVSDNLKTWTFSGTTAETLIKNGDYAWGIDENADGARTLQNAKVFELANIATIDFSTLPEGAWTRDAAVGMTTLPTLKALAAPDAIDEDTYYTAISIVDDEDEPVTALDLEVGGGATLTAVVDEDEEPDSEDILWYSSNPSVASVSATGAVTANSVGTATIYAYNAVAFARADVTVSYPKFDGETAPTGWIAISTATEFENIKNNLASNYYLTGDIDFGGKSYNTAIIGTGNSDAQAFTGVLDGRGYALKNFKLTHTGSGSTGVIARLGVNEGTTVAQAEAGENGLVRNIAVIDATITTNGWQAGILVGANYGLVENVYTEATFNRTGNNAPGGLIIGANESSKGLVKTSISNGTKGTWTGKTSETSNLGGITGYNGQIYDCFFVTSEGVSAPIGNNNTANGGATGFAMSKIASIDFSALSGDFWKGAATFGATALPTLRKPTETPEVNVKIPADVIYSIDGDALVEVGEDYEFAVVSTDLYSIVTGDVIVNYTLGGVAQEPLVGVLDTENEDEDVTIYNFKIEDVVENIVITSVEGIEKIWVDISEVEDFEMLLDKPAGLFRMTNDIDFEEVDDFAPLGDFAGVLDGRGYAIQNITIQDGSWSQGLFYSVKDTGIVRNLAMIGCVTGAVAAGTDADSGGQNAAIAQTNRGLIENCYFEDITVSGISPESWGTGCANGVIVAFNSGNGIIRNCVVASATSDKTHETNAVFGVSIYNDNLIENCFVVSDDLALKKLTTANNDFVNSFMFESADIGDIDFSALSEAYWEFADGELPTLKQDVDTVTVKLVIDDGSGELDRYTSLSTIVAEGGTLDAEVVAEAIETFIEKTKVKGYDNTMLFAMGDHDYTLEVEVVVEATDEEEEDQITYEAFTDDMLDEIAENLTIVVRLGIIK